MDSKTLSRLLARDTHALELTWEWGWKDPTLSEYLEYTQWFPLETQRIRSLMDWSK